MTTLLLDKHDLLILILLGIHLYLHKEGSTHLHLYKYAFSLSMSNCQYIRFTYLGYLPTFDCLDILLRV